MADRAEEHGVELADRRHLLEREPLARREVMRARPGKARPLGAEAEAPLAGVEHAERRGGHLGTDAVAADNADAIGLHRGAMVPENEGNWAMTPSLRGMGAWSARRGRPATRRVLCRSVDRSGDRHRIGEGDGRADTYGSEATIFLNSSSVKARSVSVVTFPSEAVASVSLATTSSLGASVIRTMS